MAIQAKPSHKTTNSNELLLSDNILNTSSYKAEQIVANKEENTTSTEEQTEPTVEISSIEQTQPTESKIDENKATTKQEEIVYDGLTRQELIDKLNRNLNSTLSGKGELFADHALELGLDPYLAVAIVLHETGCSWECSDLVKYCNNVGGQKGSPSCGNGSYIAFATLDEGIIGFMDNLYNNFYALGLTTPEAINPKYAASTAWAGNINKYIEKIKAS